MKMFKPRLCRSIGLVTVGMLPFFVVTMAYADYQSVVQADSPLVYYRFSESDITTIPYPTVVNYGTEGTAGDGTQTGNSYDCTIIDGVPGALADTSTAFSFPSDSGNGVVIPYDAGLNPDGPFSVELWVKPSSNSKFNTFASSADTANYNGWLFYQGNSSQSDGNGWWFRIYESGPARINAQYDMAVTPGTWYHLVGVYDGTYITLYVNGKAVASNQPTGSFAAGTNVKLTLGMRGDYNYPFAGAIDEPAIYPTALSASDIAAHYDAATTNAAGYEAQILAQNPVGYWHFNESMTYPIATNNGSLGTSLNGTYYYFSGTKADLQSPTYAGFESTNSVLSISGENGCVRVPAPNVTLSSATFECWLKRSGDQTSHAGLIFDRSSSASSGLCFCWNNQLGYFWNGNGSEFESGLVPPDGQWVYAALTVDSHQAVIYMYDGSTWSAATNAVGNVSTTLGAPLRIGWDPANGCFNGSIDEAAVYGSAFSAGQLRSHALAGFGDTHAPRFMTDAPILIGSEIVYVGYSFSLKIDAYGTGPLSYQWYKGGVAIADATNETYTVSSAATTDSGSYDVVVTNPYGASTTKALTVTVIGTDNPDLTTGLLTWLKFDESSGFTAEDSSGFGRNGTLEGQVGDDLGFVTGVLGNAVALNQDGWNEEQVVIVPDDGGLDFSASQEFTLAAWVNVNISAMYGCENGAIIAKGHGNGGEEYSLDFDVDKYRFFVRDSGGTAHVWTTSVSTNGAWQHICAVYSASRGEVKVYVNGIEAASGTPPSSLLQNTHDVSIGARQSSDDDSSAYDYDLCGLVDDVRIYGRALLPFEVADFFTQTPNPPYFTLQPSDFNVAEGNTANFYCSAYGRGTVTYEWQVSTDAGSTFTTISGSTTTNLVLPNVTTSMDGNMYRAIASNGDGSTTSTAAMLAVSGGIPSILADLPATTNVVVGHSIILSVTNVGTAPFTYQWQKSSDGSKWTSLVDGGRISGAQTNTLTIANVQPNDAQYYKVIISNNVGDVESTWCEVIVLDNTFTFNGGANWALNVGAAIDFTDTNVLDVTAGISQGERGSAFFALPVYAGGFHASFDFQCVQGDGSEAIADGITFCLHNDTRGNAAIGATGDTFGLAGYETAIADVAPSVALCLNTYSPVGYSWNTNGEVSSPTQVAPGDVNIANGDVIRITLTYFEGELALTFEDTNTLVSFNTNLDVGDITSILGTNTAYVGFTGSDGYYYANQRISNFSYEPLASISARLSDTNTLVLSWPANSGFNVQSTTDLFSGKWQNLSVGSAAGESVVPLTLTNQFYRLVQP